MLEQPEDSLERAGGYVSTDAHTVDDVLCVDVYKRQTLVGAESPSNLFLGDMQADLFHLTASDGNTYFPFYSWNKANLSSNDKMCIRDRLKC